MKIEYLTDYVFSNPIPFYQMKEWSDLARSEGLETFHLAVKDDGQIVIFALILKYPLLGPLHQLYIPRGPLVFQDGISIELWNMFEQGIQDLAKKTNSVFTMIEPDELHPHHIEALNKMSRKTLKQRLPHQTIKIDTTIHPNKSLENMHKKTRYNIRISLKKNTLCRVVGVQDETFKQSFEAFFRLLQLTSQRNSFKIHQKTHYLKLLQANNGDFHPFLMECLVDNTVVASHMYLSIPKELIYLHGASSEKYREYMAPYRLQWEAINYAHQHGKDWLDLWGISDTNPAWKGITVFKQKFNGLQINYPDSRLIIHNSPLYILYQLRNSILKKV
jgi:peptidoglycan pentaglycine glycine transferase (the first glycine)